MGTHVVAGLQLQAELNQCARDTVTGIVVRRYLYTRLENFYPPVRL